MRESDRTKRGHVERTLIALLIAIICTCAASFARADIFADGFEHAAAPGPSVCPEPPEGRTAITKAWPYAWRWPNGQSIPTYPDSGGYPIPVGANKYTYTVIPFVPLPDQVVRMGWDGVQGNGTIGYTKPRPADSMYFVVSPCPGDFRPPAMGDPFLQTGCRRGGFSGALTFHTFASPPSNHQSCQLVAGQTYFMMVIAAYPEDGLTPEENTCTPVPNSAAGCDVNARHAPTN